MNYLLFVLPFISAFIGWIILRGCIRLLFHPVLPKKILGFTIQGIIPSRQKSIAEQAGSFAGSQLVSFDDIERRIADPKSLEKIMPVIEEHIDQFLRVKLGKEMPMISAFIGDKTINSLKKIFMQELGTLFPQVMKNYAANLKNEIDLEKKITEKISSISSEQIETVLRQNLSKELKYLEWAGLLTGFIIGVIQLLLTLVIS